MSDAFDANVSRVVEATVSDEVLAGGWFHVFAGDGLPVGGGLLGIIATGLDWIRRKQTWRWPAHTYWVATHDDIWVLELKVTAGIELDRVVGQWNRNAVRASVGSAPNRVVVEVPGKPRVEIEGDRYDDGERALMRALCDGP